MEISPFLLNATKGDQYKEDKIMYKNILRALCVFAVILCVTGCSARDTVMESNNAITESDAVLTNRILESESWPEDISNSSVVFRSVSSPVTMQVEKPEIFDYIFCSVEDSVSGYGKVESADIFGFYEIEDGISAEQYVEKNTNVGWMEEHEDYTNVRVVSLKDLSEESGNIGSENDHIWLTGVSYDYRDTTVYIYNTFTQKGNSLVCVTLDCSVPKGTDLPIRENDLIDIWENIHL